MLTGRCAAGSGSDGAAAAAALLLPWEFEECLGDRLLAESNDQPVVQDPAALPDAAIDMILGGLIPPSSVSVTAAIEVLFGRGEDRELENLLEEDLLLAQPADDLALLLVE